MRGFVALAPDRSGHTSNESGCGRPAAAARASKTPWPAKAAKVAYLRQGGGEGMGETREEAQHPCAHQSQNATSAPLVLPRTAGGTKPPETYALARMPPSQLENFPGKGRRGGGEARHQEGAGRSLKPMVPPHLP